MSIKAFIPSYHAADEIQGKPHVVFVLEVYVSGHRHQEVRRYKAFHQLHKQLKKQYHTPDFPPKRVRNWNPKILEQRKQGLELYLQKLLKIQPIPEQLLLFLGIEPWEILNTDSPESKDETTCISHPPIIAFSHDPFLGPNQSSSIFSSIIVQGVTQGLYSMGSDVSLSS